MSVTVRTQGELEQALSDRADVIYIDSDPDVWLSLSDSDYSRVVASDSSHVVARDSAHVVARDSSYVVASDSSRVEARDSAHVKASGFVHIVAWDSSHIEAGKYVAIHRHSQLVTLDAKGAVIDVTAVDLDDPATWCDYHGAQVTEGIAYLYKAVDQQWTTDRGVDYSPGSTPEAPDWDPRWRYCGRGLHFCAHPMQSLAYLGLPVDEARFLRVGVRLDELVPMRDKARARRVVVPCVEVDPFGEVI